MCDQAGFKQKSGVVQKNEEGKGKRKDKTLALCCRFLAEHIQRRKQKRIKRREKECKKEVHCLLELHGYE